jgi:regulator of sigma E protease
MSEIFGSIWWMLVTLGVLITFHEYCHFVVARRFGVQGAAFLGRLRTMRCGAAFGRDGTEYRIAAVPLGGYVKMLDEREGRGRRPRSCTRPSTGSRSGRASRS